MRKFLSACGHASPFALGSILLPLSVALLTTSLVPLSSVSAQEAILEEIIVTARKREERLLDIPLSVQAFTSEELAAAGIADLEDLTLFSPGLDYNSQSSTQYAGRYVTSIRFRGLTTQSTLPSNQVGSLFVDGVYVLGGGHNQSAWKMSSASKSSEARRRRTLVDLPSGAPSTTLRLIRPID